MAFPLDCGFLYLISQQRALGWRGFYAVGSLGTWMISSSWLEIPHFSSHGQRSSASNVFAYFLPGWLHRYRLIVTQGSVAENLPIHRALAVL